MKFVAGVLLLDPSIVLSISSAAQRRRRVAVLSEEEGATNLACVVNKERWNVAGFQATGGATTEEDRHEI